jgi:hypothetical protein
METHCDRMDWLGLCNGFIQGNNWRRLTKFRCYPHANHISLTVFFEDCRPNANCLAQNVVEPFKEGSVKRWTLAEKARWSFLREFPYRQSTRRGIKTGVHLNTESAKSAREKVVN